MKKVIVSLIIFTSIQFIYAQNQNWKLQCIRRPLTSINFISSSKGWIFGGDIAYKTTDNGVSWIGPIQMNPPVGVLYNELGPKSIRLIHFIDSSNGWACQYNSFLLKTTNSGNNWSIVNTGINNIYLQSVFFVNKFTGWAGGWTSNNKGIIIKTTNNGASWSVLTNNLYSEVTSLWMLNDSKGFYIVANSDSIGTTTNGGNSWTYRKCGNGQPLNTIFFIDTLNGWLLGNYYYSTKTTNAGNTWEMITINNIGNTLNIFFLNTLTGWITGPANRIWTTTNGGFNWVQQLSNGAWDYIYHKYVFDIHFKNNSSGWALFGDGTVKKSTNWGNNWINEINPPLGKILSIFFRNSYTGLVISNYEAAVLWSDNNGCIWKTTDHGSNWNMKYITPNNEYVTSMKFINQLTGFVTGNGKIIKTVNGGENWDIYSIGTTLLNSVNFSNQLTGWACGYNGLLIKTTNCGNNWSILNPGTSKKLNTIFFIDANTGFIGLDTGIVLKTTNSGLNWITSVVAGNKNVNQIFFTNMSTGFIVGNRIIFVPPNNVTTERGILKTTNGGSNWSLVYNQNLTGINHLINSAFFVNDNYGWFVTDDNTIGSTVDGGNSWGLLNSPINERYFNVFFIDNQTGWASGSNGTIITTGDFAIGINPIMNKIPNAFSLHQNYPNPFNPTTKIRFDIPADVKSQTSNVKLIIYDLLGREITTLVNEQLKPGTYEVEWDGRNYASGVYLYKLIIGEFVETKKMVEIR